MVNGEWANGRMGEWRMVNRMENREWRIEHPASSIQHLASSIPPPASLRDFASIPTRCTPGTAPADYFQKRDAGRPILITNHCSLITIFIERIQQIIFPNPQFLFTQEVCDG